MASTSMLLVVGNPISNGWLMVQCSSSEMGSSSDPINMRYEQ